MDIKVFIEIPEESAIKYEVDEETGNLAVDRIMPTAMRFPFNYGYILDTKGEDGDPLDVIVFTSKPVMPGVQIKCQVIGMLEMEDEGGIDHKIIAVPVKKVDYVCGEWTSLEDIPGARKKQIIHFFEHYKDLEEGKWVKLKDWQNSEVAETTIKKAQGK